MQVLTLTEAYLEEDDYNVWCTIGYVFDKLLKVLAYIELTDSVEHFGRYLFGRILEKVGIKPQPKDSKLIKQLILIIIIKKLQLQPIRQKY
jgi:hypothetical protein